MNIVANVKVELVEEGVRELMQSPEMEKLISEYGKQVLQNTPVEKGYSMETGHGETRCYARVQADNYHAGFDNKRYNTLLKALGWVQQ